MNEIHDDDQEIIKAMIGHKSIPEDVATEYGMRMRFAAIGGHAGTMGLFPIVDMLRHLDYSPRVKKSAQGELLVRWKNIRVGVPVIVDSPETGEIKGWFQGDLGGGILSVRSPKLPNTCEVYGKFVRLATAEDDMSCLDDVPVLPEIDDDDDDEYEDDIPTASSKQANRREKDDDDDEEERPWTSADVGRSVLVEDGDAELTGVLIAVSSDCSKITVEVESTDGQGFREDYPAENVFSNEPAEVMVLAAAQAAAEKAAKDEAERTKDMI